ncbi:MAG: hypothetical protein JRI25_11455 [Deltaproteobacteria bacterium]|nr:hypothetical protein [Deltaproteobacteria bacterium]
MDDLALCMNVPPEQFRSVSQSHSTIQRQMSTGWGGKGILLALVLALLLIILAVVVGGGVLVATRTSQTGTPHFAPPVTAQPEPTLAQDLVPGEADVEEEVPAEVTEEPIEEGEGEEEETTAEPEPVAAPAPPPVVAKPRPRPPARPKPKPQPEPSPEPSEPEEGTTEETNGPEGYMGLPEDLK